MRHTALVSERLKLSVFWIDDMKKDFAVCIDDGGYPASLECRKIYETIKDPKASKLGLIRVVDESGEDYLFSENQFVFIELPEAAQDALQVA
jgi:hypothetical protein